MYVCVCRGITDKQIKQAVVEGKAECMRSLYTELGVAGDCGSCGKLAREILEQYTRNSASTSFVNAAA